MMLERWEKAKHTALWQKETDETKAPEETKKQTFTLEGDKSEPHNNIKHTDTHTLS